MLPNIRHLDLNLLHAFDALYQERSVTRAAERLSVTQPTVSSMLKRLREALDDDLFVRRSHGVVPTPRADLLAPQVRGILEAAQGLLVQETFAPETSRFSVVLAGTDYIQQSFLGGFAGKLLSVAPHARVSLVPRPSSHIEALLGRGEIDLLVSTDDAVLPGYPVLDLYKERLVLASSYRAHRKGQFLSAEAFCPLKHVLLNQMGTSVRQIIDSALQARGLKRNVALDVPNFATLGHAMLGGELVAFLPERLVTALPASLRVLTTDLDAVEMKVVANWHPRMTRDARHGWLRQTMLAAVQHHQDTE